ncbi:MAG: glycosyltransferase family 4 protein [Bacteroidetes bacterium]|nr:glycosyltransferase family 4 protein [Bacteroidota bacterium]
MKIVFDARVHLNYFSGISRYIICLLDAYLQQFTDDEMIVLINPTIKSDNAIFKALKKFENVKIETVHTAHMGPKNYLVMGRIIKKYKPDVYHYPHLDAPIFTGKIPVVATIHDTNSNKTVKKFDDRFGLKSFYFKRSLALTLKHAKKVIFVSDSIQKEVLEQYKLAPDKNRFHRIYNGLEADFNQLDRNEASRLLQKLKVSGQYLLYVGQIREHKNIKRLITAFKKFNTAFSEYKLVLVGHNYLHENLSEKNILHIEKVSNRELKALYTGCEAFLFPSLFEGFGFPILEAFSFGKKVVTTDYGATAEISGGLAELVDPLSVDSIEEGIRKAVREDDLSEKRKAHAKQFSWLENAREVRQLYQGAIQTKNT